MRNACMLMVLLHTVLPDFPPRKQRCFDSSMTWRVLLCYHKFGKGPFIGGSFSLESPAPGDRERQVTPFKIRLDRVTNLN